MKVFHNVYTIDNHPNPQKVYDWIRDNLHSTGLLNTGSGVKEFKELIESNKEMGRLFYENGSPYMYDGVLSDEDPVAAAEAYTKVKIGILPTDSPKENGIQEVWWWREDTFSEEWRSIKPIWQFLTSKEVFMLLMGESIEISETKFKDNFSHITYTTWQE